MNLKATFKLSTRFIGIFIITMAFMLGCGTDAIDPTPPPDGGGPEPPLPPSSQTLVVELFSEFISESYKVRIYLPAAYETNKNLPVIYTLEGIEEVDGIVIFEEVIEISQRIGLDAIVVAIGDHLAAPTPEEGAKRRRDFFPNGCGGDGSDGHLNFYKYVSQEVVTYIDEKYENDHDSRSLIAGGWGAVFTTVSMFREVPENLIFHGFASADPLFEGCQASFFEELIQQNTTFSDISENIKFHYAESNLVGIGWLNTFIEDQVYSFLDVDYEVFEDKNHEESIKPSFEQGLKFIYNIE